MLHWLWYCVWFTLWHGCFLWHAKKRSDPASYNSVAWWTILRACMNKNTILSHRSQSVNQSNGPLFDSPHIYLSSEEDHTQYDRVTFILTMMKTATKKPSSKVSSSSSSNNPKKTTPTTGETPEDCSETSVLSTSSSDEIKERALQKKHKHKTTSSSHAVALQGTTMDYLKHPEQRRTVKPKTKAAKSSSKHKSKKKTSSSSSNNKEKAFSSSPKEKAAVTSTAHPSSPVLKRQSVVPPMKQMRHLPKHQHSNKEIDATHHCCCCLTGLNGGIHAGVDLIPGGAVSL